ncbi:hypothetical protein M378DRAFT_169979 [Amanita muscaria Koide BX008]|uniref:Secreted protein n=1 Tax=Amanita muscaria (strain Koide BX008) TaxID=946122 RepID=A0A0C2WRT5_AMAMK|nr:hypothetical protein M378DRAFT_169979 [Amanita muscaria Koide BX008]
MNLAASLFPILSHIGLILWIKLTERYSPFPSHSRPDGDVARGLCGFCAQVKRLMAPPPFFFPCSC